MSKRTLGDYEIIRRVGAGGMAEVFSARRIGFGGFQRKVALKCMRTHMAENRDFVKQFVSEAHLGSLLQHPNIIAVHDFNQVEGTLYLAMELVDGPNLKQLIGFHRKTKVSISTEVAANLTRQVLAGLEYAHAATDDDDAPLNLIHRDIKPSNLLINRHGVVKIADFGIAKATTNYVQTQAGGPIKGSLAYMSPEQLRREPLTFSADLFCLGAVLFEVLSLEPLFTGSNVGEIVNRIYHAQVEQSIDALPEKYQAFKAILLRALQLEPAKRYADAAAFSEAIRPLEAGLDAQHMLLEEVEACIAGGGAKGLKPKRRGQTLRVLSPSASSSGKQADEGASRPAFDLSQEIPTAEQEPRSQRTLMEATNPATETEDEATSVDETEWGHEAPQESPTRPQAGARRSSPSPEEEDAEEDDEEEEDDCDLATVLMHVGDVSSDKAATKTELDVTSQSTPLPRPTHGVPFDLTHTEYSATQTSESVLDPFDALPLKRPSIDSVQRGQETIPEPLAFLPPAAPDRPAPEAAPGIDPASTGVNRRGESQTAEELRDEGIRVGPAPTEPDLPFEPSPEQERFPKEGVVEDDINEEEEEEDEDDDATRILMAEETPPTPKSGVEDGTDSPDGMPQPIPFGGESSSAKVSPDDATLLPEKLPVQEAPKPRSFKKLLLAAFVLMAAIFIGVLIIRGGTIQELAQDQNSAVTPPAPLPLPLPE